MCSSASRRTGALSGTAYQSTRRAWNGPAAVQRATPNVRPAPPRPPQRRRMAVSTLYALDPGTQQSALVQARAWSSSAADRSATTCELLLACLPSGDRRGPSCDRSKSPVTGCPSARKCSAPACGSGRFYGGLGIQGVGMRPCSLLPRKAVKLALCGSLKAKDANIRQAILDRFGGKEIRPSGRRRHRGRCMASRAIAGRRSRWPSRIKTRRLRRDRCGAKTSRLDWQRKSFVRSMRACTAAFGAGKSTRRRASAGEPG
jgi:hypothetical protein